MDKIQANSLRWRYNQPTNPISRGPGHIPAMTPVAIAVKRLCFGIMARAGNFS